MKLIQIPRSNQRNLSQVRNWLTSSGCICVTVDPYTVSDFVSEDTFTDESFVVIYGGVSVGAIVQRAPRGRGTYLYADESLVDILGSFIAHFSTIENADERNGSILPNIASVESRVLDLVAQKAIAKLAGLSGNGLDLPSELSEVALAAGVAAADEVYESEDSTPEGIIRAVYAAIRKVLMQPPIEPGLRYVVESYLGMSDDPARAFFKANDSFADWCRHEFGVSEFDGALARISAEVQANDATPDAVVKTEPCETDAEVLETAQETEPTDCTESPQLQRFNHSSGANYPGV